MNFFVRQLKGAEIGNFVNTTPTIISLYDHFKQPIPVKFDSAYVKELYKDWDKIKVIDDTSGLTQLVHSGEHNHHSINEGIRRHHVVMDKLGIKCNEVPLPYAPSLNTKLDGEYVVIARGCIDHPRAGWKQHKEVGDDIFKNIMSKIDLPIYIVGNTADYKRSLHRMKNYGKDVKYCLDDIREVVSLITGCKYMISNDTGLYHVAGALNKNIFVIWKDTPFKKNQSPGKGCFFSHKGNWEKDYINWRKKC